jgi:hypothetical protein
MRLSSGFPQIDFSYKQTIKPSFINMAFAKQRFIIKLLQYFDGENLASVLSQEWYWIIVISIVLVLVVPLGIVWFILNLPPTARLMATIAIIIIWGIVSGYKDWLIAKRQGKEK